MDEQPSSRYSKTGSRYNLNGYQETYAKFNWRCADKFIDGFADGGVNIAHEAVDRHVVDGLAEKTAIRWISKNEDVVNVSYDELAQQSSRFASVLAQLGVTEGARVYSLTGRVPALYTVALGTLKAGCIFTPLFSAFGPQPIRSRLEIGEANVLVTTATLYRKKIAEWWRELPHLKHILLIDDDADIDSGCSSLNHLLAKADPHSPCRHTRPDQPALLHFTSGTTGAPKGVVHVHCAVKAHVMSAFYVLDLKQEDSYWCTADPGWVTGTSYGIIAPLCLGVTMIVDEAEFEIERWYRILEQQHISVWYTAPTAIRLLMKAGADVAKGYRLDALRLMASVGEPLNPEAVVWGYEAFGQPFHDNWWQTETGAIMIANYPGEKVKPGSMGRPLPGIQAAIVDRNRPGRRDDDITGQQQLKFIDKPMEIGELAIAICWPSMFQAYLNQPEKYAACFSNGWYLTGDLAMRDEDGYYWYVGRADDLIKTSGHLVGPFEVESILMEHEAVAEAAVIGLPDPLTGEKVKAFVALKSGFSASDALSNSIRGYARKRLGSAVAPKEVDFRNNLPKTRSGKIMRRLLKARELNLPEGDISTLETDES